jgi:hypothetical protein
VAAAIAIEVTNHKSVESFCRDATSDENRRQCACDRISAVTCQKSAELHHIVAMAQSELTTICIFKFAPVCWIPERPPVKFLPLTGDSHAKIEDSAVKLLILLFSCLVCC